MKSLSLYYDEFARGLSCQNRELADAFRSYSASHSPREVFLWLEELRATGRLPLSLEATLTDFYWELL